MDPWPDIHIPSNHNCTCSDSPDVECTHDHDHDHREYGLNIKCNCDVAPLFELGPPTDELREYSYDKNEFYTGAMYSMGSTHSKDRLVYPGPLIPMPLPQPLPPRQDAATVDDRFIEDPAPQYGAHGRGAQTEDEETPFQDESLVPSIPPVFSNNEVDAGDAVRCDIWGAEYTGQDSGGNLRRHHRLNHGEASDYELFTPSIASVSSDNEADSEGAVTCEFCGIEFTGRHKIGNLRRHSRLGHGVASKYPCGVDQCGKTYQRKDARLKHQRNQHPEYARDSLPKMVRKR
jgi:hypothetical protein